MNTNLEASKTTSNFILSTPAATPTLPIVVNVDGSNFESAKNNLVSMLQNFFPFGRNKLERLSGYSQVQPFSQTLDLAGKPCKEQTL
jgi:hypothetical protein